MHGVKSLILKINFQNLLVAPIRDSPKPPPERVTLTYPVLNRGGACIFVSTGEGKKDIIEVS
jgi:6-phosphogluconolactonase